MYNDLLTLCIDNGIFLLPYHSFDPDCTKLMAFICDDPFDNPCSQLQFVHVHIIKSWSHYVYKHLCMRIFIKRS